MRQGKKIPALIMAAAMLTGVVSCSKGEEVPSDVSDGSVITIDAETNPQDEGTEDTGDVPQITNEDGEYLVAGETFEERYGSQLGSYLFHQYTFDGKNIPVEESNYYMIHEFVEFNNMTKDGYYELPMTSEGLIDLSFEFTNNVELYGYEFKTVGDMMRFYAEISLACSYICWEVGHNEYGIEVSKETLDSVETTIDTISELAEESGLTLDQFLSVNYGKGFDEEAFRQILIHYDYYDDFVKNYPLPEEEYIFPQVNHALFGAYDGVATKEEVEMAYYKAQTFLEACKTTDDIITNGEVLKETGDVQEVATYFVPKEGFVQEFTDWAYDENRQVGDMAIVRTVYGYHVMGFLGINEISEEDKYNMASDYANEEIYQIYYAEVYEFGTDDVFEEPKSVGGEGDETAQTVSESLNLDENGNIIIETTGTTPVLTIGADSTSKGLMATRIAAASVGGIAIIAIIGLIIATITKDKKSGASGDGKADNEGSEEDPKEE